MSERNICGNLIQNVTLILLVIMAISACDKTDYVLKDTRTIDGNTWIYEDSLTFSFSVKDTAAIYQLLLDIEHKTAYPFQNLYTLIHTIYPDGQHTKDTVPVNFADHRGIWYGNCNATDCDLAVNLQERVRFDQPGTYQLVFEQFTRMDSLHGISSMSLKMIKLQD